MDRERFDALTRALAAKGSRRGAFTTILGVAFLGQSPDALAGGKGKAKGKGGHGKGRGHGGHKGNGKGRGGSAGRETDAQIAAESVAEADLALADAGDEAVAAESAAPSSHRKGKGRGQAKDAAKAAARARPKTISRPKMTARDAETQSLQAQAGGCCGKKGCNFPTKKGYSQGCNFAGSNLAGIDGTLANLQEVDGRQTVFSTQAKPGIWYQTNFAYACLGEAKFNYADLRKANFVYACLVDADLSNAKSDSSTNYTNAILCRTKMPDGSISNRDCNRGTSCCPSCTANAQCGSGKICCNGKCVSGVCCAASDCATETCQSKACTGNQCRYTPISGTTGPNCTTICCNGVCCANGQVCNARLNPSTCCTPESKEQTCQGKCGKVINNCGQEVNCGDCPAVTCQNAACTGQNTCNYTPVTDGNTGPNCEGQGQSCCDSVCCQNGQTCVNGACCPSARVCGAVCLEQPCDASRCEQCNPQTGRCEGCPNGQTCIDGRCCPEANVCGETACERRATPTQCETVQSGHGPL